MALRAFVEETLELCIDYGASGGPNFDTSVVTTRPGTDFRNINWPFSKGRWEIGDRVVTKKELAYLYAFFVRRRGRAIGFRYKDWGDYELTDAVPTRISPVEYQLVKTYGADDLDAYEIQIDKPVADTTVVRVNGQPLLFGWSVSTTTGVLTFDQPPGGEVRVDTEYDKRVRFDTDGFRHEFEAFDEDTKEALYTVTSIPVIELR